MLKPACSAIVVLCLSSSLSLAEMSRPHGAQDAGARYAQAFGAAETCPGLSITAKAQALKAKFSGTDLEAFKVQAAGVLASWQKVKSCSRPADPNPCRIIIQLSCQSALSEIGPEGSVMPGLLDLNAR